MHDLEGLKLYILDQMSTLSGIDLLTSEKEKLLDDLIRLAQQEVMGQSFESGYESGWADGVNHVSPPI